VIGQKQETTKIFIVFFLFIFFRPKEEGSVLKKNLRGKTEKKNASADAKLPPGGDPCPAERGAPPTWR
jgi:hypothetical protein